MKQIGTAVPLGRLELYADVSLPDHAKGLVLFAWQRQQPAQPEEPSRCGCTQPGCDRDRFDRSSDGGGRGG